MRGAGSPRAALGQRFNPFAPLPQPRKWLGKRLEIRGTLTPGGRQETGQAPEFDEYALALRASVGIEAGTGVSNMTAGQAFFASKGEWL